MKQYIITVDEDQLEIDPELLFSSIKGIVSVKDTQAKNETRKSLIATVKRMREEATEKGLTEKTLKEILGED